MDLVKDHFRHLVNFIDELPSFWILSFLFPFTIPNNQPKPSTKSTIHFGIRFGAVTALTQLLSEPSDLNQTVEIE
jgi:hypothetical protein